MHLARLAALILLFWPMTSAAQPLPTPGRMAYVLDDREQIQTLFKKAETAILEGRPRDALEPLLSVLLLSRDEVWFTGGELHLGVRERVRTVMASLPLECIAAAREHRVVEARDLLAQSLSPGAATALWRWVAWFTFSRPGADALEILADQAMERGDAGLAHQCLRRYLRYYRPRKAYEDLPWPRILAKAGKVAARVGDVQMLQNIRNAAARLPATRLTVGHDTLDLTAFLKGLAPPPAAPAPTGNWTTFGGNNQRTARPDLPCLEFQEVWSVDDFPRISEFEREGKGDVKKRSYTCLQSTYPLVAGNRIYDFNGRVLAVHDLASGKRLASQKFRDTNPADRSTMPYLFRHQTLGPEGVYLITEYEPELTNRPTQRVLHAYSALTPEGTLRHRWTRGGPKDPDPHLAAARLTGSPLRTGDKVYVAGTLRSTDDRVYLFALDPRTGDLAWKRFLCAGAGRGAKAAFQRVLGNEERIDPTHGEIMVSENRGVVYVATNMGVVAALSRGDGEILWLHRYPRRSRPQNPSNWPAVTQLPWMDNPLLVVGDRLFLTPRDSDYLHILNQEPDLVRGLVQAAVHKKTRVDAEFLYLVGADARRAYLAERLWLEAGQVLRITALNLDGTRNAEAWTFEIPHVRNEHEGLDDYFTGRAQLTAHHLLVPTNKSVYILEADTGRLQRVLNAPRPFTLEEGPCFGNLIPAGGGFLNALPDRLGRWGILTPRSEK